MLVGHVGFSYTKQKVSASSSPHKPLRCLFGFSSSRDWIAPTGSSVCDRSLVFLQYPVAAFLPLLVAAHPSFKTSKKKKKRCALRLFSVLGSRWNELLLAIIKDLYSQWAINQFERREQPWLIFILHLNGFSLMVVWRWFHTEVVWKNLYQRSIFHDECFVCFSWFDVAMISNCIELFAWMGISLVFINGFIFSNASPFYESKSRAA